VAQERALAPWPGQADLNPEAQEARNPGPHVIRSPGGLVPGFLASGLEGVMNSNPPRPSTFAKPTADKSGTPLKRGLSMCLLESPLERGGA
jgi:hypothetical protein